MPTDKQIEAATEVIRAHDIEQWGDDGGPEVYRDLVTKMLTAAKQTQKCSSPNCECMFPRDCPAEPEYEQAQEAQPEVKVKSGYRVDAYDLQMNGKSVPLSRAIEFVTSPTTHEGWQPIETAPKDGTKIIVYGQWAGEISGVDEDGQIMIASYIYGNSDHIGFEWDVEGSDAYSAWAKPTHWMPLLAVPKPK